MSAKSCLEKLRLATREQDPIIEDIKSRDDMCASCRNPLIQLLWMDDVLCERKANEPRTT